MKQRLNFSPEPFRSTESRLMLLWLLNLALVLVFAWSIVHWKDLRTKNASAHEAINNLQQKQQDAIDENQQVIQLLESVNMKAYRKKVRQFHQIQTIFNTHWGRLLDDLAAILPEDVRIQTLKPTYVAGRRDVKNETILFLSAEARNKEAELDLIRALQEASNFDDVQLTNEDYDQEAVALAFELTFTYKQGGQRAE